MFMGSMGHVHQQQLPGDRWVQGTAPRCTEGSLLCHFQVGLGIPAGAWSLVWGVVAGVAGVGVQGVRKGHGYSHQSMVT